MKIKVFATDTIKELLEDIKDDGIFCQIDTDCSPDCMCKKECRLITIEIKNHSGKKKGDK